MTTFTSAGLYREIRRPRSSASHGVPSSGIRRRRTSPCATFPSLDAGRAHGALAGQADFDLQLRRDWARSQQLWLPLSLLWIDTSSRIGGEWLEDSGDLRARIAADLAAAVRPMDAAYALDGSTFAVILLGSSRNAAEAEQQRIDAALTASLQRAASAFDADLGLGFALALDDASSPEALVQVAAARASWSRRHHSELGNDRVHADTIPAAAPLDLRPTLPHLEMALEAEA